MQHPQNQSLRGMIYSLPQMTREQEQQRQKRKFPLASNLPLQIRGPPSKGTSSDKRVRDKEEGIETDPSPSEKKE
jgi:hypothetical protein